MNQDYITIMPGERYLFLIANKESYHISVLFEKDSFAFNMDNIMPILYDKIKLLNEINKIWPL